MKVIAIILNIFMPGIGTLVARKWLPGIAQILLGMLAMFLMMTMIGGVIGLPLMAGVWVWALVSVA